MGPTGPNLLSMVRALFGDVGLFISETGSVVDTSVVVGVVEVVVE